MSEYACDFEMAHFFSSKMLEWFTNQSIQYIVQNILDLIYLYTIYDLYC